MDQPDISDLQEQITQHLNLFNIFDLPEGRHRHIIEEFYIVQKKPDKDDIADKIRYTTGHLKEFNVFLETQGKYKSERLDVERQAKLEPERTKAAIQILTQMGFRVRAISNTEINFTYKGENIKYFPYSGWASGKTINDGRGLQNLLSQLETESEK